MNDERFIAIETKLLHQEQTLEDLHQVIYKQQETIDKLQKKLENLEGKLTSDNEIIAANEKPPHYWNLKPTIRRYIVHERCAYIKTFSFRDIFSFYLLSINVNIEPAHVSLLIVQAVAPLQAVRALPSRL